MRTPGKVEVVQAEMERYNISCLGLSEVRWTGKGHFRTDKGNLIIYSGSESRKEAGVGAILDKGMSASLLGYNPISNRILTIRISSKPWNLTLIQVYAPTNQATDREKEDFYSQAAKQDIVLLSGDFNAKIGKGERGGARHRSHAIEDAI